MAMRSSGGSTVYHFSWHATPERLLLGGFIHAGHPTYQVAVVGLCQAIAAYRCGATAPYDELIETWYALVRAMDRAYPRLSAEVPWDKRAIEAACHHAEIRPQIVKLCDVLRVALRYQLPSSTTREIGVTEPQVLVGATEGTAIRLPGSVLLDPASLSAVPKEAAPSPAPALTETAPADPAAAAPLPASTVPPIAPASRRRSTTTRPTSTTPATTGTKPPAAPNSAAPAAVTEPKPAAPAAPTPPPASSRLLGPHVGRIKRALDRGGPVMLVGPTATGKTTQAKDAAFQLGMGFELVVLDEGWDAAELFGGYARAGKDWAFAPGPITRWAERIKRGETVMLIIDELARGHKSVVSAIMRVMNEYSATDLDKMGIAATSGEGGPFYIVDVTATKQRIAVPCHKARIVATANQGDGYTGINLNDPAFRRRWTGGWLQLKSYEADVVRGILSERLALPHGAMLITKMQAVALQVAEYQRREEALLATLDLATLITWGEAVLRLHRSGVNVRQAFIESAADVWIDRLVPLKGADLDPEIERTIHGFVAANYLRRSRTGTHNQSNRSWWDAPALRPPAIQRNTRCTGGTGGARTSWKPGCAR
ncbi:MAG: AAA family ATPase [Kouleothrix sp.]|nr:AAA family ATPase [Kouleothrix sp.]